MNSAIDQFFQYLEKKEVENAPTQEVPPPFEEMSPEAEAGKIVGCHVPVVERTIFVFVLQNQP